MSPRRAIAWEWVLAACAAALLVDLFLPWYGPQGASAHVDAWQAFSVTDVILLIAVVLALVPAISDLLGAAVAVPVGAQVWTFAWSVPTLLVVLYRIANQPGPNDVVSVRYGAWVGAVLLAAMIAACLQAMREGDPAGRITTSPLTGRGAGPSGSNPAPRG